MKDKNLLITGVIDLDLWNKAKWKATVFLYNNQSPPCLGIAFQNREAGIRIFSDWNERFGHRDIYEEIRISIIEGEIPNKDYGYSVHINTNLENIVSRCVENNLPIDKTLVMTLGRFNRMNPPRHSSNLQNFKDDYYRFLSYTLIPVYFNSDSKIEPLFEYGIEKTEVVFKDVKEISPNDIDYCCIK